MIAFYLVYFTYDDIMTLHRTIPAVSEEDARQIFEEDEGIDAKIINVIKL